MTHPMIEKVARAIAKEAGIAPDTGWRIYAGHAQAALLALRDITPDMVEAGAIAGSSSEVDRTDPVTPYDECDNLFKADWRNEAHAVWRAMLDQITEGGE